MKLSSGEIRKIRSLAQKKYRDEYGLFVVEGEKLVEEALHSSFHVENVYRSEEIGEDTMSRISMLASPSPVLAVVRKPEHFRKGADAEPAGNGLYLGLDSLRDPGNLGTVIRIADWFGLDGIYASRDTVDIFNPKTVQSTMGAVFRVRFTSCDLPSAAKNFLSSGGKVYGTFMNGRNIYASEIETGACAPVMIVIGNEANGISEEVSAIVSDRLAIPPYPADDPGSESLNAAVASAIVISEFRRRILP